MVVKLCIGLFSFLPAGATIEADQAVVSPSQASGSPCSCNQPARPPNRTTRNSSAAARRWGGAAPAGAAPQQVGEQRPQVARHGAVDRLGPPAAGAGLHRE